MILELSSNLNDSIIVFTELPVLSPASAATGQPVAKVLLTSLSQAGLLCAYLELKYVCVTASVYHL